MGIAVDTVGFTRTAGASADTVPVPVTPSSGDSFGVRNFAASANAHLQEVFLQGTAIKDMLRIRSPMFHDNVRGITFIANAANNRFKLPTPYEQALVSQDSLAVEALVGTASATVTGAYTVYYSDLMGTAARLHSEGDIAGTVKSIKLLEVDVSEGAVAGAWVDSVITGTEDLLHANKDYAIVGYRIDKACPAVGIKGTETGNLRICGPGFINDDVTNSYFVDKSNETQVPQIPVINSANKDSLYATVLSDGSSSVIHIQFILAEMNQNLAS